MILWLFFSAVNLFRKSLIFGSKLRSYLGSHLTFEVTYEVTYEVTLVMTGIWCERFVKVCRSAWRVQAHVAVHVLDVALG